MTVRDAFTIFKDVAAAETPHGASLHWGGSRQVRKRTEMDSLGV